MLSSTRVLKCNCLTQLQNSNQSFVPTLPPDPTCGCASTSELGVICILVLGAAPAVPCAAPVAPFTAPAVPCAACAPIEKLIRVPSCSVMVPMCDESVLSTWLLVPISWATAPILPRSASWNASAPVSLGDFDLTALCVELSLVASLSTVPCSCLAAPGVVFFLLDDAAFLCTAAYTQPINQHTFILFLFDCSA